MIPVWNNGWMFSSSGVDDFDKDEGEDFEDADDGIYDENKEEDIIDDDS